MIAASLARRRGVAATCAVAVGLVLWVLQPDNFDLRIFLTAAQAVAHGHAPYPGTDAGLRSNTAFVYPRAAAWAFVPLTWVSVHTAEAVYAVVCGVCLYVGLQFLGVRRAVVAAPIVLSSFALRSISLGTVEPLLFLLLAVVWWSRDRQWVSGLSLAFGIVLKPVVAPLWLFFVLTGRRAAAASTVVAGTALWVVAAGWSPHAVTGYVSMLRRLSAIEGGQSESTVRALGDLGAARSIASAVVIAAGLALVIGVAAICRRRDVDTTDRALFSTAVGMCVLVSPIVWSHYYLLVLAALCVAQVPIPWLYATFVVSWWVTPDRRWVISPSHYLTWPPGSEVTRVWLTQLVLAVALAAAALVVARGVVGRPIQLRR